MKKIFFMFPLCIILLLRFSLFAQDLRNKIVFSTLSNPDDSIWSINGDGSALQFITLGNWPRVSSDGHYMAFLRGGKTPKTRNDLYLRDLQTYHDALYGVNGDYVLNFDFNPSVTQLTFDFQCSLYRINISDGVVTFPFVSAGDCWDDFPRIRSSDSLIAYHSLHYGIFTAKYDGSNAMLIPNTQPGDLFPSWSPDEKWISFTRDYPEADYIGHNYFKIHPDGSNLTQLTDFSNNDTLGFFGTWSKNENYIVAAARIGGIIGIYKIATDSSRATELIKALPNQYSPTTIAVGNADSVAAITGIHDPLFTSSIKIFPNPAYDFAELGITMEYPEQVRLILCDEWGKEINTIANVWVAGNLSFKLDLRSLPAGIYWCRILTTNNISTTKIAVVK